MPLVLSGDGAVGPLSATEVGYLDGVTSVVQTQINAANTALNKIGVGCRVFRESAQAIANGTITSLFWTDEAWDPLNMHSTSSNTELLTIPTGYAGVWMATVNILWAPSTSGQRELYLNAAGSTRAYTITQAGTGTAHQATFIERLSESDQISVGVWQNSGGSLNTSTGNSYVWLSAVRLGP